MKKIALLGLMALAACSAEPETGPPPCEPTNDEAPPYVEPTPLPEPEPLPPEPTPEPSPTPTPEPVPEDEQMMDDADATGMTSRVDRDAEPATEEPVPVQE